MGIVKNFATPSEVRRGKVWQQATDTCHTTTPYGVWGVAWQAEWDNYRWGKAEADEVIHG